MTLFVLIHCFHVYCPMAQLKRLLTSQLRVPLVAVTVRVFQGALAFVANVVLGFLSLLALERIGVVVMVVVPHPRAWK